MGEESQYQDRSAWLEKVIKDREICSQDRGYLVELINMSLQELWALAYSEGYKDGMLAQLVEQ